ncbi:DsbA family protein [Marinivivus vitaminiproducens]|uniref:DsbA family protein n=1 Tax=Marinivivus vitaminiproducens TaxID=3035935 RepID=UPI0027AA4867|nr:DsbA family protein [Geminicoccaceae bacterium SCSIO 64248]
MASVLRMALFALTVVCLGALGVRAAQAQGDEAGTPPSKAEIETVVRELLMREPELIVQAVQELQRRQAAQAAEHQKSVIAARSDELLHDPAAPVAGNPDGDVTMVEFMDFQCGYCRRMVPTIQALIADDPDLRVVFKELPVLGPESVEAAKAALASARQGKYLDYHLALMASEDLSAEGLRTQAEAVGLNVDRLFEDMKSPEIAAAIDANLALANELGVEGTPALVIGDAFVPGAVDGDQLRSLIARARGKG